MSGASASVHPLRKPPSRVRVVTAASLFDGHDAAINIMRRILQAQGAEVIHLGHDRSVDEIAEIIGTINYEVVSLIGKRVRRVYKNYTAGNPNEI